MNAIAEEHAAIRDFVARALAEPRQSGRVLDFGCGKQPYRDLVETAGHEYHPYDRLAFGHGTSSTGPIQDHGPAEPLVQKWDVILCTQMIQFVFDPKQLLAFFREALVGELILTYPTCWPETFAGDYWRFTHHGMDELLRLTGFEVVRSEARGLIKARGFDFVMGYGVVAR